MNELLSGLLSDTLLFEEFFMKNPAVKLFIDPETGEIVEANQAAVDFYRLSREELIRLKISDLNTLPPDELAKRLREANADTGRRFRFTHRIGDGSHRNVEVFSAPLRMRDRSVLCSIIHDISAIQEKEARIRFADELLKQLLDEMPASIAMFDRDMRYLLTSRRWEIDVNLVPGSTDHIGKVLYDMIPNQPDHWVDAHKRGLRGERSEFDLEEVLQADGSTKWYQWSVSPWKDQLGTIGGILIYMQEETERVLADQLKMRISEERLRRQIRVEAGEIERRRIARELHDGLGQLLTAAKLNMELATQTVNHDAVAKTRDLIEQSIQEIRNIAQELRPSILDDFGLVPAIRNLCSQYTHPNRSISFSDRLPDRLPSIIESSLYRITQEAITNIVKHSGAVNASIDLYVTDLTVHLIIQDDGCGMDMTPSTLNGIGMINMRERAEMLGGSFLVESSPDKGTDIIVEIPIQ
jgi:PAS domain S-box-containing protein